MSFFKVLCLPKTLTVVFLPPSIVNMGECVATLYCNISGLFIPPPSVHLRTINNSKYKVFLFLKPCTDVASILLPIDLRLDIQIACDGLQHAKYFTCDPLISQPIVIRISEVFHLIRDDVGIILIR